MLAQRESDRASTAYLSARSQGEALQLLRALGEAEERVKTLMERLEAQTTECERRLAQAVEQADRAAAVALELREDVARLISALQGLATEVDAQMRDHTASLMAGLASARASRNEPPTGNGECSAPLSRFAGRGDDIAGSRGSFEPSRRARRPSEGEAAEGRAGAAGAAEQQVQSIQDEVTVSGGGPGGGRYARAVQLAARGLEAREIARSCGLGREEVRMLLHLHSRPDGQRDAEVSHGGPGHSREQRGG